MEKETLFNLIATVEGLRFTTVYILRECRDFNKSLWWARDSKIKYLSKQHDLLEKRFRYLYIYKREFIGTAGTSFSYVYPTIPKKQGDIYIDELKSLKEDFTNLLYDLLIHYNRINKNNYERLCRRREEEEKRYGKYVN